MAYPIPSDLPQYEPFSNSSMPFVSDLSYYARRMIEDVLYQADNPIDYKSTISHLTCLIEIADSNLLTKDDDEKLTYELRELGESLKQSGFPERVYNFLCKIINTNCKFKIIFQVNRFEDLLCINPSSNKPLPEEEFSKLFSPLLNHLQKNLKEVEVFALQRELESILLQLQDHPEQSPHVIDRLQYLRENLH
jgi:hypothetical protein